MRPDTPLVIGYAILPTTGRPSLFVDGRKLDNENAPR